MVLSLWMPHVRTCYHKRLTLLAISDVRTAQTVTPYYLSRLHRRFMRPSFLHYPQYLLFLYLYDISLFHLTYKTIYVRHILILPTCLRCLLLLRLLDGFFKYFFL
jgi:hypothetical protein